MYWTKKTTESLLNYLNSTSQREKNNIYNNELRTPLRTLCEQAVYLIYKRKTKNLVDDLEGQINFILNKINKNKIDASLQYIWLSSKNYLIHNRKMEQKYSLFNESDFSYEYLSEIFDKKEHAYNDFEKETSVRELLTYEDLLDIASELGKNNYKYTVWYNYYVMRMNYSELKDKYKLTITPLWHIVNDFNSEMKKYFDENFGNINEKTYLCDAF
jgi:hypothetical protein